MKLAGWLLLVIGILMLLFHNINFTTKEKLVDAGPIEIKRKENHSIQWPYFAGGIIAVAGVVLVIAGSRKNT